jgi:uncharacterized DUF497 family protein
MPELEFEWDDAKNASNIDKHGIDFGDALAIWEGAVLVAPSPRVGENRWIAVGMVNGVEIAVVYTERGPVKRLISARRARKNERTAYHQAYSH